MASDQEMAARGRADALALLGKSGMTDSHPGVPYGRTTGNAGFRSLPRADDSEDDGEDDGDELVASFTPSHRAEKDSKGRINIYRTKKK